MKRLLLLAAALAVLVPSAAARGDDSGLTGKLLLPRQVADAERAYWSNYELTKGTATALSESAGYLGAWHDNIAGDGTVLSRDCGLLQINIDSGAIGSPLEAALRTESLDPTVYGPVLGNNVAAAYSKYTQAWTRDGHPDVRRWQPWVGYTTGWATFPKFWIWHQDKGGLPVGPWIPTGRYLQRAILGQANRRILITKDWTPATALFYGRRYAAHFGIDPSLLFISDKGFLAFHVPPKPAEPPADGVGPRPVPNDGV